MVYIVVTFNGNATGVPCVYKIQNMSHNEGMHPAPWVQAYDGLIIPKKSQ